MSKIAAWKQRFAGLQRYFGIDLRSLAMFRIALGAFLIWDLVDRSRFLEAHYTDQGIYPRDAVVEKWSDGSYWERLWAFSSFHMISGDAAWQVFLFLVAAVFAFCLLVGYRSRAVAFLSWVMVISLQNRNPHILHGGDQMIRQLLFWSMFLPLGARFSVDGLCAMEKAYRVPNTTQVFSFGSAGLLLQTAFLYWFTVALKSAPQWHGEGTALYYALALEHYQTSRGRWFLALPILVLKLGTWATILLEAVGPCLMFVPVATERIRTLVVFVFFFFHLVLIGGLMDVGPIISTSAILWICFLPGWFWEQATARWQHLPPNRITKGLEQGRDNLIRWRNRRIVRRLEAQEGVPNLKATPIAQVVAALSITYVLLWNLRGVDGRRFTILPPSWDLIANVVRLDQNWGMFAPYPMIEDGWFVMPATLPDGSKVDLLRDGAPLRWDKPQDVAATYVNERQRKYLMNLWPAAYSGQRPYFARYMRDHWHLAHPEPEKHLKDLSLFYMLHITPPPGKPQQEPRKVLLFNEMEMAPGRALER